MNTTLFGGYEMELSKEMKLGGIGLLAFTVIDLSLYIVGSTIYGPLIKLFKITPLLGIVDSSYIPYLLWAVMLLAEIVAIWLFVYIVGRRQAYEWACRG